MFRKSTDCVHSSVARFARQFSWKFPRPVGHTTAAVQPGKKNLPEELTQKLSSKPCDRAIDTLCIKPGFVILRRSPWTCTSGSTGRTPACRSPTSPTWRRWSSPTWRRSTECGSLIRSWSTRSRVVFDRNRIFTISSDNEIRSKADIFGRKFVIRSKFCPSLAKSGRNKQNCVQGRNSVVH